MQNHARVVIIGAGIAGTSVAYHLEQLGWRDIVVLEKGPLFKTGGSTSHAPGLVFQVNVSRMMSIFARETVQLYQRLSPSDGEPLWFGIGGMEVATTPERLEELKRKVGAGRAWGIDTGLLGPDEAREKIPLLSDSIYGALYTPSDGIARAWQLAEAMADHARASGGARFYGNTTVTGIEVVGGRVASVQTDRGHIRTEAVVCAAGIWGRLIGQMAGVSLPLVPFCHLYAETTPLPELAGETMQYRHPILRHQDRAIYCRQEGEAYLVGSYDHEPVRVAPENIDSREQAPEMPSMRPWSAAAFREGMISAGELMPALSRAALSRKVNGLLLFTPDGMPVLGEAPHVKGFWSAEAVWITHAGGVGKAVAEWMANGQPTMDLRYADLARFLPYQRTASYTVQRSTQQYREVYDIIHPAQQMDAPRGLRLLPYHQRYRELGAAFVESAGWERPQWFEANAALRQGSTDHNHTRSGWAARFWSPIIGTEHRAVRERVGLFDLTPFAKFRVSGPGALAFLDYVAANRMDQPQGRITYTSMLTPQGGIQCDLTVTRLADDQFLIVTGGSTAERDEAWIRRHMPTDGSVVLSDESSRWCCVGVWGPRARDLLRRVTDADVSNRGFPYLTAQHLDIGAIPVLALRISYVGELGWELYAPFEFGQALWDELWQAGQPDGAIAAGLGAFDSLRLEKGYRLWGNELHTEYNPLEAKLSFAVRMEKGDFIGRLALARAREQGTTRKLCCLTLDAPNAVVMGNEPIWIDGRVSGYVTSANYGYSIDCGIAYGYLPVQHVRVGTQVAIEYFGEHLPATVAAEPLWDPQMMRLKC